MTLPGEKEFHDEAVLLSVDSFRLIISCAASTHGYAKDLVFIT